MSTARLRRVSAKLDHSNRLIEAARFYSNHLDTLREAAYAWPNSDKALARYTRLAKRWHRESTRMIAKADELLAA